LQVTYADAVEDRAQGKNVSALGKHSCAD